MLAASPNATANEGDSRGEAPDFDEARIEDLAPGAIDPSVDLAGLDRLAISTVDGDTDGDGDIDVLHAFGARSFTIFDADGAVVFDSGAELTRLAAEAAPDRFQDDEGGPDENRADAKGVEPEGIAVGEIDGEHFAFVGLERDSGIAVYDIGDPADAALVGYIDGFAEGNLAPEVLDFVGAEDSPTGQALLLASYELSGTTVAYALERGFVAADELLLASRARPTPSRRGSASGLFSAVQAGLREAVIYSAVQRRHNRSTGAACAARLGVPR